MTYNTWISFHNGEAPFTIYDEKIKAESKKEALRKALDLVPDTTWMVRIDIREE